MVYTAKSFSRRTLDVMLGFAAGVMIAASYWSLLAPALEMSSHLGRLACVPVALGFLAGAGVLRLVDLILPHIHPTENVPDGPPSKLPRSALLVFAITLHTVEQKQPVPLDDAFAKTLGFDTVDALKESIREKKRRSHEANADRIAGAALLGMAGANLTAELDNAILDQNADHDMNALRERLRRSKMTMELYCKAGQTTPDEVRAAFRRDAERKMRSILAVQAIAKAEQITVSNAEVDAEYVRLSKLHDTPEAEIRNVLSRDAVASAVTTQKVQRFLIDHANITSVVEKE